MKTNLTLLALVSAFSLQPSALLHAATTIDTSSKYAYAANLGWMDWRGDTNHGAVIGEYVCSGYIYSANVGWINLGDGSPANGIRYQNLSTNDSGVNHDGFGNLRGYAWGANIGWINFDSTGSPKVDLLTGNLNGYAWSANCGWVSLSNATARVKTTTIAAGVDSDGDGLADAWEMEQFDTLRATPGRDSDGDGAINLEEYLAGTDPRDTNSVLRVTSFQHGSVGDPTYLMMTWSSVASRQYAVQILDDLSTNSWTDYTVMPGLGANNAGWNDFGNQRFYRVRAFRPLTP
jgi:hypothetical protein